jgi:hypothetical protein
VCGGYFYDREEHEVETDSCQCERQLNVACLIMGQDVMTCPFWARCLQHHTTRHLDIDF